MIWLELTDGLGRVWDLMALDAALGAPTSPVVMSGMEGLGMPELEVVEAAASPAVHGSVWAGWRAASRTVVLPLLFRSNALTAHVQDFMRGVVPDLPGLPGPGPSTLTAILPDSSRWSLQIRRVEDGGLTLDRIPDKARRLKVTTSWRADVFWAGQLWERSWSGAAAEEPWLLTSGGVARLGSSHTYATASITNEGHVRAWPVYTITGPATAASVGIGDRQVTLGVPVAAGETVTIDTDPQVGQTAISSLNGDITGSLTAVDFAPIEPGVNALAVTMTGTGTISAAYRPLRLELL